MCSCGLAQQRTFIVFQQNQENNYKKNAEILNVLFLLSLSAYHLETILASVYQAKKDSKSTSKVSVRSKWSRSQELFDQYFGGNKCYKSDNFAAFAPQHPQETVQNNKRE